MAKNYNYNKILLEAINTKAVFLITYLHYILEPQLKGLFFFVVFSQFFALVFDMKEYTVEEESHIESQGI